MVYSPGPLYPKSWNRLRFIIFKRDGYICQRCGIYCKGFADCHHIRSIRCGGSHRIDNLICVCKECHREIHHII
jgi:5-methylcytosine-specific restriction endonuclease McrA